jgi:glycosyltransferase involved in cell wall biosynthesis
VKVLVAHNLYHKGTPSGENAVYRAEVDLLRAHGHEVVSFERDNDDLDRASKLALALRHAPATLWSRRAQRDLREVLRRERPALAHFHNTFPQISPSAYSACRAEGVPVVQTVHNYRIACANGLFFRDGRVCEDCVAGGFRHAVRHACYRGSRAQSAVVAAGQALHRRLGTWRNQVDAYIALTEFARQKLEQIGLPRERIAVKPNFLEVPPGLAPRLGDYLIFVGKLDVYKGVPVLLDAHRALPDVPLHVVGSGPLEDAVRAAGPGVVCHGLLPLPRTLELLAGARALVMPSIWYETFGRTTMEAFALGKPVIASDLGCMRELVADGSTGLLFPPGDARALAAACRHIVADAALAARLGAAARAEYEAKFTPQRNYELLRAIYDRVVTDARGAARRR